MKKSLLALRPISLSLVFLSLLLLLSCSKEEPKPVVIRKPKRPISREVKEGWEVDQYLGMQYAVPENWHLDDTPLVNYRVRGRGFVGRCWDFVPMERLSVYQELQPVDFHDIHSFTRVKDGFWPLMHPLVQLTLIDKAVHPSSKFDDVISADHHDILEETDHYYYVLSRWDVVEERGMAASSQTLYEQLADEVKDPGLKVVTGHPLTADYAFHGGIKLIFQSKTVDGSGATEAIFLKHPYTLLMLWTGDGEGVREALAQWQNQSIDQAPPVVSVILPSVQDQQDSYEDLVSPHLTHIYADEQWRGVLELVEEVPTFLLVNRSGVIIDQLPPYQEEGDWDDWVQTLLP